MATAALLLAAGNSSRMGQPKQLLRYQDATLVRRAAETALAADCSPVLLVTGFLHAELVAEVVDLPVQIVPNPAWATGMGSSLQAGLRALATQDSAAAGLLVLLSDQPLITAKHLRQLIQQQQLNSSAPAIVTAYDTAEFGVPAVFSRTLWPELAALPASSGAQALLRRYEAELIRVPCAAARLDVDTPAQYAALLRGAPGEATR